MIRIAILLIAAATLVGGCSDEEPQPNIYAEGPVGDLYRTCYEGETDCRDYEYDLLLYLDTINLPNPRYSHPYLHVKGTPGAGGLWDRLSFEYYEYDDIPEGVSLPAIGAAGWKAHIRGARIEYCTTCYTDAGLLRLIQLSGPRDQVEFIFDPADTVATQVNRTSLE